MSSSDSKAIRNDIIFIGGGLILLVGGCIISALLLKGGIDEATTEDGSALVAVDAEGSPSAGGGGARRIEVPDTFSDTTATEETGRNAVDRPWLRVGVSEAGSDALFLRFPVEIPPSADVRFATIELTAASLADPGGGQGRTRLRISLLDTDDQGPFATSQYPSDFDLLEIPTSGTFLEWETGPWTAGESYRTSDISSLVRSFILREGYAPGAHIGLRIVPDPRVQADGGRHLYQAEAKGSGAAAALVMEMATEE